MFGGQVTYGEDQKLMFKRSIFDEEKDDNPERVKINGLIIYMVQ